MLNNFFDKVYCINLDRRPDRWEKSIKEFEKHNIEAERFTAQDGQLLNIDFDKPYKGELGGTISHLNVIKEAKRLNLKNVLILEDDVEFINDFNKVFKEKYNYIPNDWDSLYFGGNHTGGIQKINPFIGKIFRTYAIHAYAVKNTIYDIIIEYLEYKVEQTLKSKTKLPVSVAADYFIADLQPSNNFYAFNPPLAYQKIGYSDLQQTVVNYSFLKK